MKSELIVYSNFLPNITIGALNYPVIFSFLAELKLDNAGSAFCAAQAEPGNECGRIDGLRRWRALMKLLAPLAKNRRKVPCGAVRHRLACGFREAEPHCQCVTGQS